VNFGININEEKLNMLFPFFILLNEELKIVSAGKSCQKINSELVNSNFQDFFSIKRPFSINASFDSIQEYSKQIFIIELDERVLFRGQMLHLDEENLLLFAGSPWLTDVDDLKINGLMITDFAVNDPITDMLQVLKVKDLATDDVKNLVNELNLQKQALEESEKRYKNLVEDVNDIIYRCDEKGFFTYANPIALRMMKIQDEEELIGRHFTRLVRDDYKSIVIEFYKKQFVGKIAMTYFEFPAKTSKGEEVWLGQNVKLIKDKNGRVHRFQAVARDITHKKKAEDLIKVSEEKYRRIIENMNLGVLEADKQGRIVSVYDEFCKITGYAKKELIGEKVSKLLLVGDSKAVMEEEHLKIMNNQSGLYEVQVRRKDGELIWMMISGSPVYDVKGNIKGSIGIHLDISNRKELEASLDEARAKAERSLEVRQNFLANMSHEIRTPMNAILGMSKLLDEAELNRKHEKYLSSIQVSAQNLLVIINDILDLSKMEAGKLDFEETGFRAMDVINSVVESSSYRLSEKDVFMTQRVDQELEDRILLGDPVRLNQVITNLVSNAIKFTLNGEVKIVVEVMSHQATTNEWRLLFSVHDTGIGIPQDKVTKVFGSFNQVDASTTRKYGGTGLGLSICKQLVELQGGKIFVESQEGKGSVFSFELTYKEGSEKDLDHIVEAGISSNGNVKNCKVLLVEDNEINQFYATSILEKWDIKSVVVDNGLKAIEQLKNQSFDLVLMDIQMPVMGGVEATEKIRSLGNKVPIIALTANAIKGDKEHFVEAGMDDYLSKPFVEKELISIIQKHSNTLIVNDSQESSVETIKMKNNVYSLEKIKKMSRGNEEFTNKMVSLFLKEVPSAVEQMKIALDNEDWSVLSSVAHRIKPSLALFEMDSLRDCIQNLEDYCREEVNLKKVSQLVSDVESVIMFTKDDLS